MKPFIKSCQYDSSRLKLGRACMCTQATPGEGKSYVIFLPKAWTLSMVAFQAMIACDCIMD